MDVPTIGRGKPAALSLLSSERPRTVGWLQAAGLLFGDWGTSRLYVLGLAFFFASRTSFWLICAMSLLILAVGWVYTQICRIYPDGGGVYTAAKQKSRMLAVVGALLLFADYTVTASLSALEAFHYFGLPLHTHVMAEGAGEAPTATGFPVDSDAGATLHVFDDKSASQVDEAPLSPQQRSAQEHERELLHWDSPGLWAIVSIGVLGLLNLMGPKHTGRFAIVAAVGMILITLIVVGSGFLSGKTDWSALPQRIAPLGNHGAAGIWVAFVSIVLALSGVEAIANLTGVMKKPVAVTARRAIWIVAIEVAVFNVLLALFMHNLYPMPHDAHKEDMLAYLSRFYMGPWGEWAVRIIGGLLLLSAANTAINGLTSVVYVVSRDGELPTLFQKVNRYGAPWVAAVLAASVPALVLIISHDLEHLAALYAIGVVGAVAINTLLVSIHPRLRKWWRKAAAMALGALLLVIWVTLAFTKLHALAFVTIVMAVGLTARAVTKWYANRQGEKPSLLRRAIIEQLSPEAAGSRKYLLGTYGSDALARAALRRCKEQQAALVVCFIRQVALTFTIDRPLSIDSDLAAEKTFAKFLDLGHEMGVPVLPVYDTGPDAALLIAENAAIYGCEKVFIGTSRQGALYHLIKGTFQRRLETLLPPELPVEVITPEAGPPPSADDHDDAAQPAGVQG